MTTDNKDRLKLRDIMLRKYLRLGESHTLHEVMGFLTDKHFEENGLPFLAVIAEDGAFAGLLEPQAMLSALMENQASQQQMDADSLMETAMKNLSITVGEIMNRNIPTLSPEDHLEEAFLCLANHQTEAAGIIEDGRVIGLITARILFEQASTLTVGSLTGGVIPPTRS